MKKKIEELLAVLDKIRRKSVNVEHKRDGDDVFCLVLVAEKIAEELAKENNGKNTLPKT